VTTPPPATPGHLLWHLALRWRVAMDRALAPLELTNAQYALLASLYGLSRGGGRPSQRELADFSGLEPMYVSKLARGLEAAGRLRRDPHPDDPRAVQLTLTEAGEATVVEAAAVVRALHDRLLAPLGGLAGAGTAELTGTLRALHRHAGHHLHGVPPEEDQ